jgi:hypothetical protein
MAWTTIVCAVPEGTTGAGATDATPVITAAVLPSIEILPAQSNLAGTCGGASFDINTFINVDTQASADVMLSALGVGIIEQFTDETGSNVGPFTGVYTKFHIPASSGGLAPNTAIQLSITTYTGHALSGSVSYTSSMLFNCTNGAVLGVTAAAPGAPPPIPTLSDAALAAMAGVLALLGMLALRRRRAFQR